MTWMAAWTGGWEGAAEYWAWEQEYLEDIANGWEYLAATCMQRKLGAGFVQQVLAEQGLYYRDRSKTRRKERRWTGGSRGTG